jgi:hypothetical protein
MEIPMNKWDKKESVNSGANDEGDEKIKYSNHNFHFQLIFINKHPLFFAPSDSADEEIFFLVYLKS